MQPSEQELWERYEAALAMEHGEAQLETARELVEQAQAGGHDELLVMARFIQLEARLHTCAPEDVGELVAIYVHCLGLRAKTPQYFDEDRLWLLWRGLGVIGLAMVVSPSHPVAQIRAVLDDMEAHGSPDDRDLHTIYLLRMMLEARVGDLAAADAAMRRLRTLPAPDYMFADSSHLASVDFLVDAGRDRDAVEAMQALQSGQVPLEANTDVSNVLDHLLLSYLRLGMLDEAREAHRRNWRKIDDDAMLACHLEFCARSGNEARGHEVLQDNINLLVSPPRGTAELRSVAAAALLARRMGELGRGEQPWIWPGDEEVPGDEDEEWTYNRLYPFLRDGAMEFARELDRVNGTTYQSEFIDALIHAEPIVEQLPLSPIDVATATVAQPEPAPAPVETPADTRSPTELLDAAEHSFVVGEIGTAQALLDRLDAALVEPLDDRDSGRHAELQAAFETDFDKHSVLTELAVARYRRVGDEARAQVCLGRHSQHVADTGRIDEATALVNEACASLQSLGDGFEQARAEIWRARVLRIAGDTEASLAALARAEELAAPGMAEDLARCAPLVGWAAFAWATTVGSELEQPRPAEALQAADRAIEAYRAVEMMEALADVYLLKAFLLQATDGAEPALDAFARVTEIASPGSNAAAVSHAVRGESLLHAGDPAAAIPELVEAVAAFTARGDARAAFARTDLATSYRTLDQFVDAAECAEQAVPMLEHMVDEQGAENRLGTLMQALWMLVQSYEGLDQPSLALNAIDRMLARARTDAESAMLNREAGEVCDAAGRHHEAAELYRTGAAAFAEAGDVLGEVSCLRIAASQLDDAEETEAALGMFGEVDAAISRLDPETDGAAWEIAMWQYDAAVILAIEERYEEALQRALSSSEFFRSAESEPMIEAADELVTKIRNCVD